MNVPGLGFVGVADEVVRLGRLGRDGRPLAAGRERGAAAAHQLGRGDFGDDGLGADREGPREGGVPAVRPVVVERGRIDDADPAEQGGSIGGGLREIRARRGGSAHGFPADSSPAMTPTASTGATVNVSGVSPAAVNMAAGARSHRPRHGTAQPRRAAVPDRFAGRPDGARQVGADALRAGQPAGDVVADMGDDRWPRGGGEQGIERGDAVCLGRRDRQALADVVERRRADPADPRLDRVECRQELGPTRPDRVAAARGVPVRAGVADPADPARLGWAEHGIHRGALGGGGERPDDVQIHQRESSDRPRTRRCRPEPSGRRRRVRSLSGPAPRARTAGLG